MPAGPFSRLRARTPRWMQVLVVPLLIGAVVTASAPGWIRIRVHSGDTASAIAQRWHTSLHELIALNHLPGNGNLIFAGQTLLVPRPGGAARHAGSHVVHYTVRPGDSLYAIAARFHVKPSTITHHNHVARSLRVYVGQHLAFPAPGSGHAAAPSRPSRHGTASYASGTLRQAAHHRALLRARWVPTAEAIRADIRSTARSFGVDPSLALAVAYMESGFNQREVSDADAIGVMQVVPSSADFVSRYIVGRRLNIINAHDDIVAGVGLLSALLRQTSVRGALEGYNQGLASVRANGVFPSTRAYVHTVLVLRRQFR